MQDRHREREVHNSDRAENALPRNLAALADYAAHDLAELAVITTAAPADIKPHLLHIGETMTRLALCVDAVVDEGPECSMRIAARTQNYEESLKQQSRDAEPVNMGELLVVLFRQHAHRREGASYGPGASRQRGVGFSRDGGRPDGAYGGG